MLSWLSGRRWLTIYCACISPGAPVNPVGPVTPCCAANPFAPICLVGLVWPVSQGLRMTGPVFSYKLQYIVAFWLVEMAISTNQKPTIYRNLYENTAPVNLILIWLATYTFGAVRSATAPDQTFPD